jgi:hypothetical protein
MINDKYHLTRGLKKKLGAKWLIGILFSHHSSLYFDTEVVTNSPGVSYHQPFGQMLKNRVTFKETRQYENQSNQKHDKAIWRSSCC